MLPVLLVMGSVIVSILAIVLTAQFIFNRKASDKLSVKTLPVYEKKYKEINPIHYRSTFLRLGMVLSIGLSITAISWKTYERKIVDVGVPVEIEEDFIVEAPRTRIAPPPPPVVQPPVIKVVENHIIIDKAEEKVEEKAEEINKIIEKATDVIKVEEKLEEEETDPYVIVEEMPEFPGGEDALLRYLASIKYPPIAKDNDIEGKVYVHFIVNKKGEVTDVYASKGAEKILNEAAVAHVKKMPNWTPGRQRGKTVSVIYNLPINFMIN